MIKSDLKKQQYERDKNSVLEWLKKYAYGVRNARTRKDILPFILLHKQPMENKDRYFREIASELRHNDHIGSTSSRGYWFIPLHTNDPVEVNAAIDSITERESRAYSELEDCKRQKAVFEARKSPQLFSDGKAA